MDMSLNKLKVGIVAGILPQAAVELKTRLIAEAQKLGRPVEVVMTGNRREKTHRIPCSICVIRRCCRSTRRSDFRKRVLI